MGQPRRKVSHTVTVDVAADALARYKQSVLFTLKRPQTDWSRATFTPRQVRYAAQAIGRPSHVSRHPGDPMLLDSLEVAVLALYVAASDIYGVNARYVWAGLLCHGDAIREGLRVPSRRLAVEIFRGRVAVVPARQASPEAVVLPLAGLRADIEGFLADATRHRTARPRVVPQARDAEAQPMLSA